MNLYTIAQLRERFIAIISNIPACVITQVGDNDERIEQVIGTTEKPTGTSNKELDAWRRLFDKSGIVYTNVRSVYLAVSYKNGFALHAIGDDDAPRTGIKGVIKLNGKICTIAQPNTDEIVFESVEEVKQLMDKIEGLGTVAI